MFSQTELPDKPTRQLSGRGQAALGAFYDLPDSTGRVSSRLVKEDKPGTCLAESLVIDVKHPLHKDDPSPILQADISFATKSDKTRVVVSNQPAFTVAEGNELLGLDQLILRHKRNPKTLASEESAHPEAIAKSIADMPTDIKKQLAYAIYISQLNGDESLHTGQFMVEREREGAKTIKKIQRIDFGALGRYADSRQRAGDIDPLHTSSAYANSGQLGKDYVSYLLQDNEVRDHLLSLWAQTDLEQVKDAASARFTEQVNHLGVLGLADKQTNRGLTASEDQALTQGREAINGFYKQLTQVPKSLKLPDLGIKQQVLKLFGSPSATDIKKEDVAPLPVVDIKKQSHAVDVQSLKQKYLETLESRCLQMQTLAKQEKVQADKLRQIEGIFRPLRIVGAPLTPLGKAISEITAQQGLKPSEQMVRVQAKLDEYTRKHQGLVEQGLLEKINGILSGTGPQSQAMAMRRDQLSALRQSSDNPLSRTPSDSVMTQQSDETEDPKNSPR